MPKKKIEKTLTKEEIREKRIKEIIQSRSPESEVLVDDDYGTLTFEKGVDYGGNPYEAFEIVVKSFGEGFEKRSRGVGSGHGNIGMRRETYTVENPILRWDLDLAEEVVHAYRAIPKTKEEFKDRYPKYYDLMFLSLGEDETDKKFGILEELVLSKEQILKGVIKKEVKELAYQRALELLQEDDKFGRVKVFYSLEEDDEDKEVNVEYVMGKLHKVHLPIKYLCKTGLEKSDKHFDCDTNPRTFEILTEGFKKGLKKKLFERSYKELT